MDQPGGAGSGCPHPTVTEAVCPLPLGDQEERSPLPRFSRTGRPLPGEIKRSLSKRSGRLVCVSKICSYARVCPDAEAAKEYGWELKFGEIARFGGTAASSVPSSWRLKRLMRKTRTLPTLLAPYFREAVEKAQKNWRKVVSVAVDLGCGTGLQFRPGLFRRLPPGSPPANLLQAQRDYFGAHTTGGRQARSFPYPAVDPGVRGNQRSGGVKTCRRRKGGRNRCTA